MLACEKHKLLIGIQDQGIVFYAEDDKECTLLGFTFEFDTGTVGKVIHSEYFCVIEN
jgi:hypothetical protein